MDQLNKFLIDTFGGTKLASATPIEAVEPNEYDRIAFKRAFLDGCVDEKFLASFEGTPLAPQAIALCEQELAMEQAQLQARMARDAQNAAFDYTKECNEREGMRLQKLQLTIQLHKMKTMGVGAPTPPGQAVIGTPDPAAAAMAAPPELGGGAEGGAPVQEPAGGKLAALMTKVAEKKNKAKDEMISRGRRASTGATIGNVLGSPVFSQEFTPGSMIGSVIGGGIGGAVADGGRGALMGAAGAGGGAAMGALAGHGVAKALKLRDPGLARGLGSLMGATYGAPIAVEGGRAIAEAQKRASLSELIQFSLGK
jgi:hypothetical protein